MVGAGQYTYRRRYISPGVLVAALLMWAAPCVNAQGRVLEKHEFTDPEGRLLAFYSAAMSFSPAGIPPDASRFSLSLEVSHVPYLNEAQRRPSIDKPESTNLAPFFPRPRATVRLGSWHLEASWIPPMEVFEVEANLVSGAVIGPSAKVRATRITPRLWFTTGRIKGSMTCSAEEMLGKGADLETYYNTVCHGRESEDWFEPRTLGGEVIASQPLSNTGLSAYAMFGARYDRTKFDIGVLTFEGERDTDHPILELDAFRPHAAAGLSWRAMRNNDTGLEVFYAPGSLLTMRVSGRWTLSQ